MGDDTRNDTILSCTYVRIAAKRYRAMTPSSRRLTLLAGGKDYSCGDVLEVCQAGTQGVGSGHERSVCGKDHCSIQRRGLKVIGNVYRLDWHKVGLDSPHHRSMGFKLPQAVVYLCPVASLRCSLAVIHVTAVL